MPVKITGKTSHKINQWLIKNARKHKRADLPGILGKLFNVQLAVSAIENRERRLGIDRSDSAGSAFRPGSTDDKETALLEYLRKNKSTKLVSVEDASDHLDCGVSHVRSLMESLRRKGHNVNIVSQGLELSRDIPKAAPTWIDVRKLEGKVYRFGLTADNHLGSKYARMDVLNALFDIYEKEGVDTVYQCGNMIDGEARFNKFDLIAHGIDHQIKYFAENWPKRKGVRTLMVTGDDHEGWYVQREGVNIGQLLQDECARQGRDDVVYLGHMEHDVIYKGTRQNVVLRLIHAGGGASYATSYAPQKIVESYQGGEKPHVLLVGHYHKAEYGYPREVHVVQAGCTQDQTPFLRKQKIQAHIGGWICEMTITPEGILSRFKCEWIPFYDKGFYENAWKYQYGNSLMKA